MLNVVSTTVKTTREEITLIIDDYCDRKRKEGKLYFSDLRPIVEYYCCKHVAYGKYSCSDNNFFYKSSDQIRPAVPNVCPFPDSGRLYPDTVDEVWEW